MRLLLVHRYFWPDTPPYASMLRYLGANWCLEGHEVYVFTSQPSYKSQLNNQRQPSHENVDGCHVVRCRLIGSTNRIAAVANTLLFVVQLVWFILSKRKFDAVIMSTVPQVIGAWAASLSAKLKNSRFVYHMQDIHPEGAVYAGVVKSKPVELILKYLDLQTCRRASNIIVLSNDMKATLLERDNRLEQKLHVIKNPPMKDYNASPNRSGGEEPVVKEPGGAESDVFRVVFAGNIGRFQGLETIVDAGIQLRDSPGIKLTFVGDGKARAALEDRAKPAGSVIEFVGHKTVTEADQVIAAADMALITLAPDIYKVAFPSKILSYTKLGVPIVAVVEPQSELAMMVDQWNMGFTVNVGDVSGLASGIRAAADNPELIAVQAKNVKHFGLETFCSDAIKLQWRNLLESQSQC